MAETSYAIALGSNRRHGRFGAPERVIVAAVAALAGSDSPLAVAGGAGGGPCSVKQEEPPPTPPRSRGGEPSLTVEAVSPIIRTPALGPAGRGFANAAAIVTTALAPPEVLALLKQIERAFGRRPGRRWGPRVLDLDIILWSSGLWVSPGLAIPHPEFRARRFVLDPLAGIAPDWRDPLTGLTVRQLRAHMVDRRRPRS